MKTMRIFIWRHSNLFSSWSMHDEPKIYNERYATAEIVVLAESKEEALQILAENDKWDVDELQRFEPEVLDCTEARIIASHVTF